MPGAEGVARNARARRRARRRARHRARRHCGTLPTAERCPCRCLTLLFSGRVNRDTSHTLTSSPGSAMRNGAQGLSPRRSWRREAVRRRVQALADLLTAARCDRTALVKRREAPQRGLAPRGRARSRPGSAGSGGENAHSAGMCSPRRGEGLQPVSRSDGRRGFCVVTVGFVRFSHAGSTSAQCRF